MKNKYSENWKDSWNPEEWQGRTRFQVSENYKIGFIALTGILVIYLLYSIL